MELKQLSENDISTIERQCGCFIKYGGYTLYLQPDGMKRGLVFRQLAI